MHGHFFSGRSAHFSDSHSRFSTGLVSAAMADFWRASFGLLFVLGLSGKFVAPEAIGQPWNTNLGYENRPLRAGSTPVCPVNTQCVPLTMCPILNTILSNECVLSTRIGNLGCGYQGSNLVCCPQVSEKATVMTKQVDGVKCGIPSVQGFEYEGIGSFPWIVRVGFKNIVTGEVKYPCTGSILNSQLILTAAHCALAKADNYKIFAVRVGEYRTNTAIDCGEEFCGLPVQDIPLAQVIVHPGYEKHNYRNNIALLVLKYRMNFTITAQPVCLPDTWLETSNKGVLVGWGKTARQTVSPPWQQVLHLPIVPTQVCQNVYGSTLPVSDDQLCAGGQAGNDACSGFGGAPLMVRQGDVYYQVGILSFGSDQCGAAGIPSVYTNVKKYLRWITENTPRIYG